MAATLLFWTIAGNGASPRYAPLLPLAPLSLLLDLTAAGERLVAVGERGHILYSDDAGDNWTQAQVPTTQMLTSVCFIDQQRGWAAGHDGLILVSDDGGTSWRIQRDGIAAQLQANLELRELAHTQVNELRQALASASGAELEELELALEDAVMDLEDADLALEEPAFASPLMDIWFQDREHGWAVGAFGTLLATLDGGRHWTNNADRLANPDEFHLNAITGDGQGRVFIAGEAGGMYRSTDGGSSWETLQSFYEGSWFGALYSPAQSSLLVFGLRGNLYRSPDFGDSWQPAAIENQMTLAGGNASESGEIILAGAVGTILRSSDGGLSFRRTVQPDRLSLSSGLLHKGRLLVVGQGGARVVADKDQSEGSHD